MKKVLSFLSAFVMIFSVVPMSTLTASAQPQILSYDSVSTYYSNYNMTINVFGRINCPNTRTVLERIVDLGIDKQSGIKVQFIEIDLSKKAQVEAMAKDYSSSNITFCYDTTYGARSDMFDFAEKKSITLPLTVFRKGDDTIFEVTEGSLDSDYLLQLANDDSSGNEIIDLNISGQINFDYANEVLDQLNNLRKSLNLSPLTMDEKLLNAAMQRAAELSVYYSHTRPNGENCFSVLGNVKGYRGENIAIGYTDPTNVMYGWTNSSGHYKNMTNNNYTRVGIGCFQTSDGRLCWVQLFSSVASGYVTQKGTVTQEFTVQAKNANLSLSLTPTDYMHSLTKGNNTRVNIYNRNKGYPYSEQLISSSSFNFTSSNNKVLTFSNRTNSCTIQGNGAVKVTATHKNNSKVKLTADYSIGHIYSNNCDASCNYCRATRIVKHTYSNDADITCNICGADRPTSFVKENGVWYYTVEGKKVNVTTLCKYGDSWIYVKNGKMCWDNTLVKYKNVWYHVKNGTLANDTTLVKYGGTWIYVKNGKKCFDTTLVKYGNTWIYVKNGKKCFDNTLVKYKNVWYHVKNGTLANDTTLVKYGNTWIYVKNGKKCYDTTLVKYGNTWIYVKNGQKCFDNTLVKYANTWIYVKNGKKCFDTTLVKYGNTWIYVKNGQKCFDNTLVKYGNNWYHVKNGTLAKNTSLVKYGGKWYYVKNGKVDFTANVKVKCGDKWYTVRNGVVQ